MDSMSALIETLATQLQPWRAYVIAIDGRDGVGKSPLARKLAFELRVPLVETDLFLLRGASVPNYREKCLSGVLRSRLDLNLPVIVEGIFIQQLLTRLKIEPNFVVYVTSEDCKGSYTWAERFAEYEAAFDPANADQQINWRNS